MQNKEELMYDTRVFSSLTQDLEKILHQKISVNISEKANGIQQIKYTGKERLFELYLWIFEPKDRETEHQTNFQLDRLQIKIVYIEVEPKGIGLGTKIIQKFEQKIQNFPFKRIILQAEGLEAANFWENKVHFTKQFSNQNNHMPNFYKDLKPSLWDRILKIFSK